MKKRKRNYKNKNKRKCFIYKRFGGLFIKKTNWHEFCIIKYLDNNMNAI
ncbi:hypothetical protein Salpa_1570 [Sporomusa sp. KB1]|jgi:hypothetical protein|nr:hypothetical protein Salpa_1570 [Sporomusa sp. KB1]